MTGTRRALAILLGMALGTGGAGRAEPPPALPRGEVIERVVCAEDPSQSYALYLPSRYEPGRRWPILYALDARGRARVPLERFRAAAESLGWIVASSHGSTSDGPMEPNFQALRAMWRDTHSRLAVDDRRAYAAGFSGTVRAACTLAFLSPGTLAGVIGAGAGFPFDRPPSRDTPFLFFGTVGNADFNFYEMMDLESRLSGLGHPHRVEVFDGGHDWMPEPLAHEALAWMDLQAMRSGAREKDPALLEAFWSRGLERARSAERAGRPLEAFQAYSALASDVAGLRDPQEAREAARRIEMSEAFRRERQARDERLRRDREYLEQARRVVAEALASSADPARVLTALRISALRKDAARAPDPEERLSAKRRLDSVRVQTAFYLPRLYREKGDPERAALALAIAAGIAPDDPEVWYDLAAAQARRGARKKALDALERAVEAGWKDRARLEGDEDFAPLRSEAGYRRILERLGHRPGGGSSLPIENMRSRL